MVKLRQLLGNRREVYYECMYTKHKTQKRKIWNDGFLVLYDSRRLVLYEDSPPDGTVLDEAKMTPNQWERMEEEYISIPKFLVEVVNETPIQIGGRTDNAASEPAALGVRPVACEQDVQAPAVVRRGGLSRAPTTTSKPPINTKFKNPLAPASGIYSGAPPPAPYVPYRPSQLNKRTASGMRKEGAAATTLDSFDFARNPTSEWNYNPNAPTRTADEVAAIWFGDELFD